MKTENADCLQKLKHLVAENESLKAELNEYRLITVAKEKEIQYLKIKSLNNNEIKSKLDNKELELEILQNYIDDMKQQAAGAVNREMDFQQQAGVAVSINYQLQDLQQQHAYLKIQFTDIEFQLQECNNRNILLQQQTSHMAQLQSSLEDARHERDEWKALSGLKE